MDATCPFLKWQGFVVHRARQSGAYAHAPFDAYGSEAHVPHSMHTGAEACTGQPPRLPFIPPNMYLRV